MPYKDPEERRAYQRRWCHARRQQWIDENGPCVDCGSWEEPQVDHADATLKISHRVWTWADERRIPELAKCVVRCAPCHRAKTVRSKENARGEKIGAAKLNAQAVRDIRISELGHRELGRMYGVDEKSIREIRLRHTWIHIE